MKSMNHLQLVVLLFGFFLIGACGEAGSGSGGDESGSTAQSERPEPPEEFANLNNPHEGQSEAISEGESLYQANCSSCHGTGGEGDGPASAGLNPKPQNLAQTQASLNDGYLYWRISEGGLMEPFNSVMPAWRGILEQDQIWQIVSFIRTFE